METSKNIIISNCNGQLGTLACQQLVNEGHIVYAFVERLKNDNDEAFTEFLSWVDDHPGKVLVIGLDITDQCSVDRTIAEVMEDSGGRIDVLVNLTEVAYIGVNESLSSKEVDHLFQVNTIGADRLIKSVLPMMRRQCDGLIINLSSVFGKIPSPLLSTYSATKVAIEAISVGYYYELKPYGIDVAILQPGIYPTVDTQKQLDQLHPEIEELYSPHLDELKNSLIDIMTPKQDSQDPIQVIERMIALIHTQSGNRPLWNIVGAGKLSEPVEQMNNVTKIAVNTLLYYIGANQLLAIDDPMV